MSTFILAFAIMVLAMLGLAAGVLLGRPGIQGSCGGAAGGCALCSRAGRCREHETGS